MKSKLLVGTLVCVAQISFAASSVAQCVKTQHLKFTAPDTAAYHQFGTCASDLDLAALGAFGADAIYVFRWNGEEWEIEAKLKPVVGGGWFGITPQLHAGHGRWPATVFAPQPFSSIGGNPGRVHVFDDSAGSWEQVAELRSSFSEGDDRFGRAVALDPSGESMVIGAYGWRDERGAAFIFRRTPSNRWVESSAIFAGDGLAGDRFGASAALQGNTLVVGAPWVDDRRGAVYLYEFNGSSWKEHQRLQPSGLSEFDEFGGDVGLNGNKLAIGVDGKDRGSVFVYRRQSTGVWVEEIELTGPGDAQYARFGADLELDHELLLVGAPGDHNGDDYAGSVHLFRDSGAGWVHVVEMLASDPDYDDSMGSSVCRARDGVLAWSAKDDDLGINSGAAYYFDAVEFPLLADAEVVQVGQSLTLTLCGGAPGGSIQLFLVNLDGRDGSHRVGGGRFGPNGSFQWTITVPPRLAGHVATFQAFAARTTRELGPSSEATVTFQ